MLVIRLSRTGRKRMPHYRVVLQEQDWSPSSKAIEILGHVNPNTSPASVELKTERVKYWLAQGAQPSTTMHNMLVTAGLIQGKKKRSVFGKPEATAAEVETTAEGAPTAAETVPETTAKTAESASA